MMAGGCIEQDPEVTREEWGFWERQCLRDNSMNVLEWPSQSFALNPIQHLWRDLKIAVHRQPLSNLTELERIWMTNPIQIHPIQVCTTCQIILKKIQGCNCCQRCFNKALSNYFSTCDISFFCFYYIYRLLKQWTECMVLRKKSWKLWIWATVAIAVNASWMHLLTSHQLVFVSWNVSFYAYCMYASQLYNLNFTQLKRHYVIECPHNYNCKRLCKAFHCEDQFEFIL